jgi:hypothetical protein
VSGAGLSSRHTTDEDDPMEQARINQPPYKRADVAEALPDLVMLRGHLPINRELHPLAEALYRGPDKTTMMGIAGNRLGVMPGSDVTAYYRALTSSDFGDSLGTALDRVAGIQYQRQSNNASAVVLDVGGKGYKPTEVPTIDAGELKQVPRAGGPIDLPVVTIGTGNSVTPVEFLVRFLVSRELMISDELGVVAQAVNQLVGQSVRIEGEMLGTLVNTNANLADGSPLITGNNDLSSGGDVDAATLNSALAQLATQAAPSGSLANLSGAILLVAPNVLATAWALVATLASSGQPPIRVVPNSWLTAGTAYLLADPQESPVFVRSIPDFMEGRPEVVRTNATEMDDDGKVLTYDGQAFLFRHVVGIAAVDRLGIVRLA